MRIFKILILGLSVLLLAAIPALAEEQTLIGNSAESTSVWGIDLKSSPVMGQPGLWFGGYNGRIINNGSLFIGSEGYILLTPIDAPATAPTLTVDSHVGLFYCGLNCEYNLNPSKLIHISGSISGGVLYVKYVGVDYNFADGLASLCFVVEPGVNVMMNVTDSFKAGVGVSYRSVSGLNIQGLTDDDLKGVSINLIFKFVEF
jgi:hypothetical protein